jgi:hypothetical protein
VIANDKFDACFGAVVSGDTDNVKRVAKAAVSSGFAIVVDKPGQKAPLCTLTARGAKTADSEAQNAAKEAGDPRWQTRRHACGLHHAITDVKDAERIISRLVKTYGGVNIGIELGRSRLLVVDVDTRQEKDAFLAAWSEATGQDESDRAMTVSSPGSKQNDEWVHSDGGHFWFELPDGVDLPVESGVYKGPGGWAAMWRDRQVLVPPSVRAEGAYKLVGQVEQAPQWLIDVLHDDSRKRAEKRTQRAQAAIDGDSPIDKWAATASWDELLEPDGWHNTGIPDRCGCPVWTAPGAHSSPKSATAHDLGCDHYSLDLGHGPLHVWTDNPPEWVAAAVAGKGSKTLTKLTYLSYRFYDGNDRACMNGLGIGGAVADPEFPGFDLFSPQPTVEVTEEVYEEEDDEEAAAPAVSLLDKFLSLDEMESLPALRPLVEGVMDLDTLCRIVGKSNHGKTFACIDLAGSVATGRAWHGHPVTQGVVAYIAAEGASGFRKRARAWEAHHGVSVGRNILVLPEPVQVTDGQEWHRLIRALEEIRPVLVVLDTQARITVGAEENSAKEMGVMVERLEQMRRATGACVALVHHLGHAGDQARGSSSVIAAVSTEIKVAKDDSGLVSISCSKQKDAEYFDTIRAELVSVEGTDSAVLLGPDPFDVTESASEPVWKLMARHIHRTAPTVGVTRSTACSLTRQEFGCSASTAYRAWDTLAKKGIVAEILDDNDKPTRLFTVSRRSLEAHGIDYEE